MRKVITIVMVIGFLLMAGNVFAYEQPEVTGSLDYTVGSESITFSSYIIDRNFHNEPIILLVYTYTNNTGAPSNAHELLNDISCYQNKHYVGSGYPGYEKDDPYHDLYYADNKDIENGESIECCVSIKPETTYDPIDIKYSDTITGTSDIPIAGTIDLSQINHPEPYDLDLSAGHYTGGLGIPTGTYSINLVSGHGNVISRDGDINEIFGEGRTTYYNNFSFTPGIDLEISGSLIVHIQCDAADFGAIKQREIVNEEEKILYPGKYGAGYDFPSGTYFIQAYEGHGNVHSSEADINEILSVTPEEGHSIYQYNYATFKDGAILEISSCTIKLLPAGS